MNTLNWIGLFIWIAGFGFETYSDSYLKRYKTKSENKGTICMSGPWKYSRFPNYFGEILLWYGTYLISVSATNFWTIIGPVTLNLLILKVTGVPFLEEKYRKRPEYLEYSRKVPRLVPFSPPAHLS
jgi:steroid 5-alpha reductase family enzyme